MSVPRGLLWLVISINAVLGVGLVVVALGVLAEPAADRSWGPATSALLAVVGLAWVVLGAVGFHRSYLHRTPTAGRSVTATTVEGAPAVVVPWRRERRVWALATSGVVALLLIAFAIGLAGGGNPGWWLPLALAVLVGFAVPDGVLGVLWRPRVVLTPDGVTVRGWYAEAGLAWDDVWRIDVVPASWHVVLRITGQPGASSWRVRRRRRLLVTPLPPVETLEIPLDVVDVLPSRLVEALGTWARSPAMRAELASGAGRRRLVNPA